MQRLQPPRGRGCSMSAPSTGMKGHGISNVPDAWFAISARVSSARAVASCISETLPNLEGMSDRQRMQINEAGCIACAVVDLLELCQRDVDLLEAQLKGIRRDDQNMPGGAV